MQDLALEVREVDGVVVDETDRADTRGREVHRHRGAETTGTDDQHARVQELALSGATDLVEDDVPRVPLDLLF